MTQPTDTPQLEIEEVRAILEAYFATGELDEALEASGPEDLSARELFAYISELDRAREHFDRLAVTDRALRGPEDLEEAVGQPAAFEREFGHAAFDEKLDEVVGAASSPTSGNESQSHYDGGDAVAPSDGDETTVVQLFGSGQTTALAAAAVAVLVAGVVLYQFGLEDRPGSDGQFQPRSAAAPDDGPDFAEPDLELYCAQHESGQLDITGTDQLEEPLRCPLDAELKIGYRNRSPNLAYAAFFGVDKSGTIYWYGPSPAAPAPVAVEQSDEVEPIGETIRLNVNHAPGPVRVHAVLSPDPIDHAELARRLHDKSDRELWRTRRLTFEQKPSASTSMTFRVVGAETDTEEAR
ncbi:MAG: hypothetical protein ABEN55_05315 [Bradymonadaceae bacterium]